LRGKRLKVNCTLNTFCEKIITNNALRLQQVERPGRRPLSFHHPSRAHSLASVAAREIKQIRVTFPETKGGLAQATLALF
jgi:hypothetical protein